MYNDTCKICGKGQMKEYIPLDDNVEDLTKTKVDRCDKCGAYRKTTYDSKGDAREKWIK